VTQIDATLRALIDARARCGWDTWIDAASDVRLAFPAVSRHVGRDGLDAPGATLVTEIGDRISLAAWRIDDAARVLLLRESRDLKLALELYRSGDAREKCGVLRALAFLPGAATNAVALPAILDAMRMAQGEIFEAGLLDNAYAAVHLPQLEWRKAALKAVFVGHALRRVIRLEKRADAELSASLLDLATEREAAGRAVPPELWPIAAMFPPPGLAGKLLGYLEHPADEHRAAAAQALGRLRDPRVRPFLVDRAAREPVASVRDALQKALEHALEHP